MNDPVSLLREIELEMTKKLPAYAKGLNAPATDSEIQNLKRTLKLQNEEILSLYRWHNGGIGRYYELIPGGRFCDIKTALEVRTMNSKILFLEKRVRGGLPIIYGLNGDMYFALITNETVDIYRYEVGERSRYLGSLSEFLKFVLEYWKSDEVEMENELFLLPTEKFYKDLNCLLQGD